VALVPTTGDVCQMTGELYGVFQAKGWVFNQEIDAVDGDAWLVLNDTRGEAPNAVKPLPAHPALGDRDAHYEAHLMILGYQVFATPQSGTGNVFGQYENHQAPESEYNTVTAVNQPITLGSDDESWTIPDPEPEIPFSIGPIPCYISGYAELELSVAATASVQLPPDCRAQIGTANHEFGPLLQVTPSASLSGVAEAGVGIAGIASVGVRGELTMVDLQIPATTSLTVKMPAGGTTPNLDFQVGVDGSLATLSGSLGVYFQILMWSEENNLFTWPGAGPYPFMIVPPFNLSIPIPAVRNYLNKGGG
jgi:hypothetical protein